MLSGTASQVQVQVVEQHVSGCEECQQHLRASRKLAVNLLTMDIPEPSAGFENRVMNNLDTVSNTKPGHWFVAGFGSAVAASILFVMVFFQSSFFTQQSVPNVLDADAIVMTVKELKLVSLVFNSPEAINAATISIELPEHVALKGYPNRKVLSWKTNLKSGANRLSLPLIAAQKMQGAVIAKLKQGDQVRDFRIQLNVKEIITGSRTTLVNV